MMPIIISYIYKFVSFNMYEAANNATENSHTEDQDYLTLTVTIKITALLRLVKHSECP